MASVFLHQPSTFIKAGIHHQRGRRTENSSAWDKPAWDAAKSFICTSLLLCRLSSSSFSCNWNFLASKSTCCGRLVRSDLYSGNIKKRFGDVFYQTAPGDTQAERQTGSRTTRRPAAPDLSPPCCLTSPLHFEEHKKPQATAAQLSSVSQPLSSDYLTDDFWEW